MLLARLEGLEPPTHGLEGRCSIQLSYRRTLRLCDFQAILERVMGIGPTQPAWKAGVLPLNYTRTSFTMLDYFTKKHRTCQMILLCFSKYIFFFST